MIIEDYVSFEVAKLLKEKGFNELCHATYDTAVKGGKPKFSEYEALSFFPYGIRNTDDKYSMVISAPTLQMAMKWLRGKYNIHIEPRYFPMPNIYRYVIICSPFTIENIDSHPQYFNSYEEAVEAAIKYCLENLI